MNGWLPSGKPTNAVLIATAFVVSGLRLAAQPIASFSAAPTAGCAPLTVAFQDNSAGADAWFWDFGNGNTSVLQNPATVYLTPGFFTVRLVAINTLTGQRDTFEAGNYIHVIPSPATDFSASPLSACVNANSIAFTNLSTGAVNYTWDFGDGNTSTLVNPVHAYAAPGSYTVKLVARNGFNCSTLATRSNYIDILPTPSVSFTTPFNSSCDSTDLFQFTGTGSNIAYWEWSFGDGGTATGPSPTHQYNQTGSFTVTLIATGVTGCTDTVIVPGYINIGSTLTPGFNVTQSAGCDSLTATFSALVQNAVSWQWQFGDGGTSTQANPVHVYAAPGTYTVTLSVTTANGCNGSASYANAIVIEPMPTASFTASQPDPCDPFTFQFANTSGQAVSYLWEFGDGTTSTAVNPIHTYSAQGTYAVTLHAFSAGGCEDVLTLGSTVVVNIPHVNFSGTPRSGCPPLAVDFTAAAYPNAVSWFWQFGDGTTSTQQHPSHTYTVVGDYKVSLAIATSGGCQDSIYKNKYIKVVDGQVSYTVPDTIYGCWPYSVSFANPLPGCDTVIWNFGNGDTSTAFNASYIYQTPGVYTVSFYGSMPGGCSQSISPFAILVVDEFIPDSSLTLSASTCKPYTFQFTNPTPGVIEYLWEFGDGTTDTVMSPVHVYAQAGTYTVTLTLTNLPGCSKKVSTTVTFGHPNPIQPSGLSHCAGDTVAFTITDPSLYVSYAWDFGDGTPGSALQNPSHAYTAPGAYVASVVVTDTIGCVDTFYTDTLFISVVAVDFYTTDATTGCDHLLIKFHHQAPAATAWHWQFGDGDTAVTPNPTHYYGKAGTYTVSLTVSDGICMATETKPVFVTVYEAIADFSYVPSGTCYPVTITCSDSSVSPVTWAWDFGDGTTSALQNPVHTFLNQPAGKIQLTITDIHGCSDTKKRSNVNTDVLRVFRSDSVGCDPLTVSFSDSTANAVAWQWDFGDGGTSNLQHPVHTYTAPGMYAVRVSVTVSSGCTHDYAFPDSIRVTRPTADFTAPSSTACAPALFQFTDLSSGAVAWFWTFGDGTTSTSANPTHIYSVPGDYTVSLAIRDASGCTDTLVKKDYIKVKGTYAYFTLTALESCMNTFVQFVDSSINATSWQWNFGDGHTSTLQNPSHTYVDTGSYIVSLITSDTLGCSSYYAYPDPIVVHPAPTASGGFASVYAGCEPLTVAFTDSSSGASAVHWLLGNGDTLSGSQAVYTYTQWGQYYVTLVATNNYGCSDTFHVPLPVQVYQNPVADFEASPGWGCAGQSFTLLNTSTGLQNPTWLWTVGSMTSTQQQPSLTLSQPGLYGVTLAVVNATGCSDTLARPGFLEVLDTVPPPATPILDVSVLDDVSVEIRWLPSADLHLKEYRLYRLNPVTQAYDLIHILPDSANANPSVNLVYVDAGLNTLHRTYTYKVQVVNACDRALPLAQSVAHTTIDVTAQAAGEDVVVQWTPYGGCPVQSYEVRRTDVSSGQTQLVATVPGTVLGITDTTSDCPVPYAYRITATGLCGNPYHSLSDTGVATPVSPVLDQQADIVRSTVVDNSRILTEWLPPLQSPQRVSVYYVYRSVDGTGPWTHVATVPAAFQSYIDDQVRVDRHHYDYRVDAVNDCGFAGKPGQQGVSILLESDWKNDVTKLNWSPYDRWQPGVDHYVIEKRTPDGQWMLIKVVDGNTTATELNE